MKTKEEILAEVTGFELDELTDRTSMPIIDIDDIYTAMEQYATQQVQLDKSKQPPRTMIGRWLSLSNGLIVKVDIGGNGIHMTVGKH